MRSNLVYGFMVAIAVPLLCWLSLKDRIMFNDFPFLSISLGVFLLIMIGAIGLGLIQHEQNKEGVKVNEQMS